MFSAPNLGSQGPRFESCLRRNSAHDCKEFHCIEPFIITVPLSLYDLDNAKRDVKYNTIIIQPSWVVFI